MAEMLQFPCPVCGITLQLPSELAGQQGPCPRCHREIIAPRPRIDSPGLPFVSGREEPKRIPDVPFADPPSQRAAASTEPSISSVPEKTTPSPEISPPPAFRCRSRRTVLFLSCALTGLVSLALGYLLGQRSPNLLNPQPAAATTPIPEAPSKTIVKTVIPPPEIEKTPQPPAVTPPPHPTPPAETTKTPEEKPGKVSDQALAVLKAFLEAPDWASRNAYVLHAESLRTAMEAYSHEVPDGPTPYRSIRVAHSATDPETGETLFIFHVETEEIPSGIPVAVQETPKGWFVDWLTFVEFRDDRFTKFTEGPVGTSGVFHLIVSIPEDISAQPLNEHFVTYQISPPLPDREKNAYCRIGTGTFSMLQRTTPEDAFSNLVLEVAKKASTDGKSHYLEILNVRATDWRPSAP
ncbi:MAG: hypothetical protein QM627_10420 [Luteolibacter sp.]